MPGNRGRANQALFEARILLEGWEAALQDARRRPEQLGPAYLDAIRMHLGRSYGWFLLAVAGGEDVSDATALPQRVDDLPAPPPGREHPPELREFARLEREGWLSEMLASRGATSATRPTAQGLLGSDRDAPGTAVVAGWLDAWAATMARMDDALDEC